MHKPFSSLYVWVPVKPFLPRDAMRKRCTSLSHHPGLSVCPSHSCIVWAHLHNSKRNPSAGARNKRGFRKIRNFSQYLTISSSVSSDDFDWPWKAGHVGWSNFPADMHIYIRIPFDQRTAIKFSVVTVESSVFVRDQARRPFEGEEPQHAPNFLSTLTTHTFDVERPTSAKQIRWRSWHGVFLEMSVTPLLYRVAQLKWSHLHFCW